MTNNLIDSQSAGLIFLAFGGLFLIGLAADLIGRKTPLPRVTSLLLAGCLIGPGGLDWLPDVLLDQFQLLTDFALAMIGFLLGGKLLISDLKKLGRAVISLSLSVTLISASCVFVGLLLINVPAPIALLLAAIATATAPVASFDVVREISAEGEFTKTLLGIVALDDAWGLLLFSFALAGVSALQNSHVDVTLLIAAGSELVRSMLVGIGIGLPAAFITGRVRPGEPTLVEALGIVLIAAGTAAMLGLSGILLSMVVGATVANLATHHERPFHAIEDIEWPFLIVFFMLAGASLDLGALTAIGSLGIGYVVLRIAGRFLGAQVGGWLGQASPTMRNYMGFALLPQAGVALGMALLASQRFPEYENVILPVVMASTVLFELVGPPITRWVLIKVGDAH